MKLGDLIKHKRASVIGVVINIFATNDKRFATVFFSNSPKPATAPLTILEDNWEVISDR